MNEDPELGSEESNTPDMTPQLDPSRQRFPFCIVWTPIPIFTWIFPFLGHMGIAMSTGVIRDFAGPYYVSEDNMAFGWPTKYLELDASKAKNGARGWDMAVTDASEIYKTRMHNLCCDNCHSHVAKALNKMNYNNSCSWNMVKLAFWITFKGKYVSFGSWCKTWIPFFILVTLFVLGKIIPTYFF